MMRVSQVTVLVQVFRRSVVQRAAEHGGVIQIQASKCPPTPAEARRVNDTNQPCLRGVCRHGAILLPCFVCQAQP